MPSTEAPLGFMTFIVSVKPEQRARLGAVTHVDGTARIHVVSRSSNPLYSGRTIRKATYECAVFD